MRKLYWLLRHSRFFLGLLLMPLVGPAFSQEVPTVSSQAALLARTGETQLHRAARTGNLILLRSELKQGIDPNIRDRQGRTPLMYAAEHDRLQASQVLIKAGADLDAVARGWGSALEIAERSGHTDIAEMLRKAGARSSGRSVGDTVCVRPWDGEGYCGIVQAVDKTAYRVRVTLIVGCKDGCPVKPDCSAGREVGGRGGIAVGDEVHTVSWCLTHTGVKP